MILVRAVPVVLLVLHIGFENADGSAVHVARKECDSRVLPKRQTL